MAFNEENPLLKRSGKTNKGLRRLKIKKMKYTPIQDKTKIVFLY